MKSFIKIYILSSNIFFYLFAANFLLYLTGCEIELGLSHIMRFIMRNHEITNRHVFHFFDLLVVLIFALPYIIILPIRIHFKVNKYKAKIDDLLITPLRIEEIILLFFKNEYLLIKNMFRLFISIIVFYTTMIIDAEVEQYWFFIDIPTIDLHYYSISLFLVISLFLLSLLLIVFGILYSWGRNIAPLVLFIFPCLLVISVNAVLLVYLTCGPGLWLPIVVYPVVIVSYFIILKYGYRKILLLSREKFGRDSFCFSDYI